MKRNGDIFQVYGMSHRTAPVEIREKLAFSPPGLGMALRSLGDGVILSTCNRVEVYYTGCGEPDQHAALLFLSRFHGLSADEIKSFCYHHSGRAAVRHLFRVAAGLDSLILGEHQILGQIREAYRAAREAGCAGIALGRVFEEALSLGREARRETGIGRGAVSVSAAGVELARNILGGLDGKTVLIVGAGKMGELAMRQLLDCGVGPLLISNRTYERAAELASRVGGVAVRFSELPAHIRSADVVISSTNSPAPVIDREMVRLAMGGRKDRPLVLIDIAVPRDIDPGAGRLSNVRLCAIDDLKRARDVHLREREREAVRVEGMIEERLRRMEGGYEDFQTALSSRQHG